MLRRIALFVFLLCVVPLPSTAYDPQSVVISLERGPCFGSCPVYRVVMYGDGTVRYDGKDHVRLRGSQTAVIASENVKELAGEIERIGFFNLRDLLHRGQRYRCPDCFPLYRSRMGKRSR